MPIRHRSIGLRDGFALAALVVAVLARWLLGPLVGEEIASTGILLAILASAWHGGFGPAALVTVGASVLLGYFFPEEAEDETVSGAILYFVIAFGMALLGAGIAAARRRTLATVEELRTTLQSIGDAVLVTDMQGRVKSLNPVAEQLTGWSSEEAVGQPLETVFVVINEQTRKSVENPAIRSLREGAIVGLANHSLLVARNGTETPIDDSAAPIRSPQGRVIGVVLVFRDVTERRRAEKELSRERETARFLADCSAELASLVGYDTTLQKETTLQKDTTFHTVARLAVPFFADWCAVEMIEPDGRLRSVAVAHVDPAKVELAQQLHSRFPPDPQAPAGVGKIIRTGEPEIVPEITDRLLEERIDDPEYLQMLRQLGPRSYLGVPIEAHGKIFGAIVFLFAESNRRYSEGDLAIAEDLAHRVAIAVENTKLYQALRQADQRKDEFLAMLAHELRNPLAPIRTGLELLALTGNEDRDTIQLMQQQVAHLVRLVDDLLDVSRIVRGKIELRQETIALDGVVNQSATALRPLLGAREQRLDVHLPDTPTWVSADSVRLAQILENLLSNASKYTDPGGRIELAVTRQDDDAVISVRDSGIGIEPELLPQVFDLFTQSSRALDRAQGGLGIGLTLVRNLVEMHGGSVAAHSEGPGHGSTFSVRLPAVEAEADKTAAALPIDTPPADMARRVLIVDDNESAARLLAILIGRLGPHEVKTAHDGAAALRLMTELRPDIVLLDIGLPGMDGYDVARTIRADPETDGVLLAALTGYGQDEDRRKSCEAGFDEHLVKPVPLYDIALLFQHPKLPRDPCERSGSPTHTTTPAPPGTDDLHGGR